MLPIKMLDANAQLRKEIVDLKNQLKDKEILEYNAWKKRNPTDRTAMDKVIAEIKKDDDQWIENEESLTNLEIQFTMQNHVFEILKKMISSVTAEVITREEFDQYANDCMKYFKD